MDKKWGGANFTKPENLTLRKKFQKTESFQKPKNFPKPKNASNSQKLTNADNSTNLIHAKEIIDKIKLVDERYETSNDRAKYLLDHINKAQNSINQVVNGEKGRSWGSLDKNALLSLIIDVNRASSKSVSSISDLIKNNNENSKLLAEMISALTVLSGLSFEQISETTAELEEIASHLQKNTNGNKVQGIQIKRIIVSQIEKFKEEKERTEENKNNFNVIFQKLRENEQHLELQRDRMAENFHLQRNELTKKVEEIEIETINTIKVQRNKMNFLSVVSITNLIIVVAFIIYFFSDK
ncbi:hypothetical protein SAMN05444483_105178 [Salegentibacter echinorum]|uniref:Uncharacterized protein n=1 Tax=Salegentibacter echinorum TaxID=1073325 RepID=A0A1M5HJP7_SALEC|nr:hypothetical protein [Salegentibacter echinorum]SHG16157.1 hypothetical protein SAMN05444483_105178 [Salegentibacter echinorum]